MLGEDEGREIEITDSNYNVMRTAGDIYSIKGEPLYPEFESGAHYYAFSPHTTDYKTAIGFFEFEYK